MKQLLLSVLIILSMKLPMISQTFSVSPIELNFNIEPGKTKVAFMTITNGFDREQKFKLYQGDFYFDENGKEKNSAPGNYKYSIANQILISPAYISMQPNESRKISITIRIPESDKTARWGMIFVEPAKERNDITKAGKGFSIGVSISTRIAARVYQNPPFNNNCAMEIKSVKQGRNFEGNKTLLLDVINTGEVKTRNKAHLTLLNMNTLNETKLIEKEFTSFPKSLKSIMFKLPDGFPAGKYSIVAAVDYHYEKPLEAVEIELDIK